MRRSYLLTFTISILLTALPGTFVFADVGLHCTPYQGDNEPSCNYNPYNLSENECRTYCENSDYCMLTQDGQRNVFGGFWRDYGSYSRVADCRDECNHQKDLCDPTDQACLDKYIPQSIDCSLLTNETDQDYCKSNCIDNILTSECGRSCLKDGIESSSIGGCQEDTSCSDLCVDHYCASIPMKYETKLSVFWILMILLAAMSSIILVVMHKKGNPKTEDSHS